MKVFALFLVVVVTVAHGFVVVDHHPKRCALGTATVLAATRDLKDDEPQQQVVEEQSQSQSQAQSVSWKRRAWSQLQQVLWPGAQPDPHFSEPLPPGSLGCPFFGSEGFLSGNKVDGPGYFYRQQSASEGHPTVVKFYFFGTPVASVSGAEWVKKLTAMEFSQTEALSASFNDNEDGTTARGTAKEDIPSVFGTDNIMFERNKKLHSFLRRLVGKGVSTPAVKTYFKPLQQLVTNRFHDSQLLASSSSKNNNNNNAAISMESFCHEYTLDVTQNLVLGLDLAPKEVAVFRQKLVTWLGALYSPLVTLVKTPWIVQHLPEYHARHYIQDKIEAKIDALLESGIPEDSVLSSMVFAVDDDENDTNDNNGTKRRLTRQQIVENSLLLIITGSESSAGTLTLIMFLLGLHPDKYQKLVQEQQSIIQQFGPELTQDILENHCPYLNGVRKEALRIGAVTGGYPKRAKGTILADGVQIPKGWSVFCNIRLTHLLDPVARLSDNSHMCVFQGFQPERWFSPETTPSDFMPYGSGPRRCFGKPLANLQMQLFLATLARNVQSFELEKDYQGGKVPVEWYPSTITPRPSDGTMVKNVVTF